MEQARHFSRRQIRGLYPSIREDHLRYLERWNLIRSAGVAEGDVIYEFGDVGVIRHVAAELARGMAFRSVVRTLASERAGQLALDFQSGRGDQATAKVVALPSTRAPSPPPRADVPASEADRLTLAARYFEEGAALDGADPARHEEAAALYRRALGLDPRFVPALVNLANFHYNRDGLAEAEALYGQAIRIDPAAFEAWFNLGHVCHDLDRFEEACTAYTSALRLEPDYADAHFYLAVTLEKLGRSTEAKPHWRRYQELAPDGEWVELAREFSE